jgi:hypothetical protein
MQSCTRNILKMERFQRTKGEKFLSELLKRFLCRPIGCRQMVSTPPSYSKSPNLSRRKDIMSEDFRASYQFLLADSGVVL